VPSARASAYTILELVIRSAKPAVSSVNREDHFCERDCVGAADGTGVGRDVFAIPT
jgi:hypothetical protein